MSGLPKRWRRAQRAGIRHSERMLAHCVSMGMVSVRGVMEARRPLRWVRAVRRPLTGLALAVIASACGSGSSSHEAGCEPRAVVEALTDYRQYDVFLVDREGGFAPITQDRLSFSPDVAPDGSWLAFVKAAPGSWSESFGYDDTSVETMALDGSEVVTVQRRDGWNDSSPAIAPDGHRLTFIRRPADASSGAELTITDRRGEHVRVLADLGAEHAVSTPAWSPDGSRVAVAVRDRDYSGILLALDAETGEQRGEWPLAYWQDSVAWSPDGDRLVISSSGYESAYDLSVVSVERGDVVEVSQPDRGSWTNAKFDGSTDQLTVLSWEADTEPTPQHAMEVTLDGAVISRIELERHPTVDGAGLALIGDLSTSDCFSFDFSSA